MKMTTPAADINTVPGMMEASLISAGSGTDGRTDGGADIPSTRTTEPEKTKAPGRNSKKRK